MTNRIHLSLAGFSITLTAGEADLLQNLAGRFRNFLSAPIRKPDLALSIERVAVENFISPSSGIMEVEWSVENGRMRFRSTYEEASLDLASRRGTIRLAAANGDPENFLRVFLAYGCLQSGGLTMHSSGAVREGSAYLFFGPSGAGKTTIARLSESVGLGVLGDDIVALRKEAGTYVAYSLPFGNREDFAERLALRAPIAAMYRLRKAAQHEVRPLTRVQAVTEMIAAVPFIHVRTGLTHQALAVCQDLQRTLRVCELAFYPHATVWEVIA